MTPDIFNSMDQPDQANLIWNKGEFIISRSYYGRKLNLYSLPGYFAEISYDPLSNEIDDIRAIDSKDKALDKYLPYLDISV